MSADEITQDSGGVVTAHPAATVIPLRDKDGNLEVLLIRRNPELPFQGGAWVFPGGRVEQSDYSIGDDHDLVAAARRAAVRETAEESGLTVVTHDLVPVSHWTTPEESPKRYATWFFATHIGEQKVSIDDYETCDYCWFKPRDALEARKSGEIVLLPPTFVSILELSGYGNSETALDVLSKTSTTVFYPRMRPLTGGFCQLYAEDVAYGGGELDMPGERHRLWAVDAEWLYERSV